jgi:hypothetical protein
MLSNLNDDGSEEYFPTLTQLIFSLGLSCMSTRCRMKHHVLIALHLIRVCTFANLVKRRHTFVS